MKQIKALILIASTLPLGSAWAAPGLINYQGRLTNSGGTPITVATNVTFTFWDSVSTGTQLGSSFSDTDSVTPDIHGLYSTDVGDDPGNLIPAAVFASDSVWLNVNVAGENLAPRLRVMSSAYTVKAADSQKLQGLAATAFLNMSADAYVVVQTTASATQNATNLLAAYTAAKLLTPNGAARSASNRAAVLVPPGNYDLGTGQLTLDAEFVDLLGLSTKREAQYIFGTANGTFTSVLRQTADNVGIENLRVRCTRASGGLNLDSVDPVAYFPNDSLGNTVVRNCKFEADDTNALSMQIFSTYPGTYENCVAGDRAFGNIGDASGTFTNCTGGFNAFGGNGSASGTFTNCTGGDFAFGGAGLASGTFTNCTGGTDAFGGILGSASNGKFYHCNGGTNSFTSIGAPAPVQLFCTQGNGQYAGND